jgi:hypothetical protein
MILRPTPRSVVRVTATSATTGKSRSMTVYETTPESVIAALRSLAAGQPTQPTTQPRCAKQSEPEAACAASGEDAGSAAVGAAAR